LDSGEDYDDCARREIAEELGIRVEQSLEQLFKLPASLLTGNEHCMVYRYAHDGPMVLHPEEIDDGRWISPAAMDRRVADHDSSLTDSVCLIWKQYRALDSKTF
ncbi:MAG: NUDIX domain-containing protein, partial [Gammaproteobacteria bacterium]|nr:NUDIX domain-containing protein [Gammaproteobacteria bacterium]